MSELPPIKIPRNLSTVLPYSPGTNRRYNKTSYSLSKGHKNPLTNANTRKVNPTKLPPLSSGATMNRVLNALEKAPSNPVGSTKVTKFTRTELPLFGSHDGGRKHRSRKHRSRKLKKNRH